MTTGLLDLPVFERTGLIAGILFDKDGTLLDFDESWAPVNRSVALMAADGDTELAAQLLRVCGMDPESGHVLPDSLFAAANTREIAAAMIAAGAPQELNGLTLRIDEVFADAAGQSVPVTDLAALFSALSGRGLKLGIASSDNEKSIRAIVSRFRLEPYVDFVAGYDSGHGVKPEPGMVEAFCLATGLDAARVAMVGDNNHDLNMGRNAGVGLAIGVLSGTGLRATLEPMADLLLENVGELLALLPNGVGQQA